MKDPHPEQHYPGIADYGFIGDTRTGALVSCQGSIDWLCMPDFDSASLLAAVVDRLNGGRLLVTPIGDYSVERRYLGASPVLQTCFTTRSGRFTLTDFFPLLDDARETLEPEREIIRILEVVSGDVEVELLFTPRPGYATLDLPLRARGRTSWTIADGGHVYLLRTDLHADVFGTARLHGTSRLEKGDRRYVSLSLSRRDIGIIPGLGAECEQKRTRTVEWWNNWWSSCRYQGPLRREVIRSAVTLRMLTFSLSGAVLAAASCSLPETLGGNRNWDYRYCWLRDASFILRSFLGLGMLEEAKGFFDWLLHATRHTAPTLLPLYSIYGRTDNLRETTLQHMEGYRGSGPVRIGNGAEQQLQLDVYGSLIEAVYRFVIEGGSLEPVERRRLRGFGERVCELWRQPDDGIWEMRGARRHTTYSKLMCWAALHRLLQLHDSGHIDIPEQRFRAEAGMLRQAVLREGWSEDLQAFSGAFGHNYLDASLLLMPVFGIIDANDPRMRATWDRVVERLGSGSLIYRYEGYADSWQSREGSFLACGFWGVEYLARRGDVAEARSRLEDLTAHANDLGLYAEELDPDSGQALGNFPQAFSHVGLINAALSVQQAETDERCS